MQNIDILIVNNSSCCYAFAYKQNKVVTVQVFHAEYCDILIAECQIERQGVSVYEWVHMGFLAQTVRVCVRVCAVHDFELSRCYVQFKFGFVLYCKRSSNNLNFPLGRIRYHTMLCYWLLGDWQPGTSYSLHYSHFHLLFLLCTS